MSRTYKFHNPEGAYFMSFAVVEWLNVFESDFYKDLLVGSLKFCQEKKGMEIFAWCIMSNHVHLVFRSGGKELPQNLLGDFKRFTSTRIVNLIRGNPYETRKEYWLERLRYAASQVSNVKHYQFWQHDNQPIEVWSNRFIAQKIRYVHNNPVNAGLVSKPEDYLYSSARSYAGKHGLLEVLVADI